jgi:hypothetical protein
MTTKGRRHAQRSRRSILKVLLLGGTVAGIAPMSARAEVKFEGTANQLRITTNHDAIADVLAGLSTNFDLKHQSAIRLDAPAQASYSGSVRQVIARLLDGYNYVIRTDRNALEVIVIGGRGEKPIPAPQAPPGQKRSIVSQWR